jgi:hypothetical protein
MKKLLRTHIERDLQRLDQLNAYFAIVPGNYALNLRKLYVLGSLITQRSVVQIHPPQPFTDLRDYRRVPNSKSLDRGCFGPQILQGNVLRPILQLPFDRGWQNQICYPAIECGKEALREGPDIARR